MRLYEDNKGAVSAGRVAASAEPLPPLLQSERSQPGNNSEPRRVADLERQLETVRREAERQIEFEQTRSVMLEAENRRMLEALGRVLGA